MTDKKNAYFGTLSGGQKQRLVTASGFVEERERGIYRRLSLTPLKRQALIGGQILQRYLVILAQTVVLLIVGILAFKVKIAGNYSIFWLILTFGALCFISVGFVLTTFIKSSRGATVITLIVFFLMMFLGDLFIPTSIMPNFLEIITKVLPSTHLSDALRLVMINGAGIVDIWKELLVLGGWLAGCLTLSIMFFRWE